MGQGLVSQGSFLGLDIISVVVSLGQEQVSQEAFVGLDIISVVFSLGQGQVSWGGRGHL